MAAKLGENLLRTDVEAVTYLSHNAPNGNDRRFAIIPAQAGESAHKAAGWRGALLRLDDEPVASEPASSGARRVGLPDCVAGMFHATSGKMKTHLFPVLLLSFVLAGISAPIARADALQKDTPGAQGTEGTNPTHQDSDVTGPNGEHSTNTNPANTPPSKHHKKHHKTCSSSGSCSTNTTGQ